MEGEADFITIVSSEMIAEVMQEHFNKHMYKKKVTIVDLKATETGYMFSLAFLPETSTVSNKEPTEVYTDHGFVPIVTNQNGVVQGNKRDGKGKFTSKQTVGGV